MKSRNTRFDTFRQLRQIIFHPAGFTSYQEVKERTLAKAIPKMLEYLDAPPDRTYPHSKRIRLDDSIRNPSVPRSFIDRWNFDPADSFNLLPVVDAGWDDYNPPVPQSPALAPAIPQYVADGDYWEWKVVRCPHCGAELADDHSGGGARIYSDKKDWKTEGWKYSLHDLGWQWASYCPRLSSPPNQKLDKRNMYYIGISSIPNQRELDKYFPSSNYLARRKSAVSEGGVYFIKAANRYKIGISGNPKLRIASIATSSPFPLETVHIEYTDDYIELERYLHRALAHYRVHLEWFEFPDDLIPNVIDLIKGGAKP